MSELKPTLLILAAGMASRYGSLKQIDRIGPSGERIIDYSVHDAVKAGFKKIVFVIRKNFENEFREVVLNELPGYIETRCVFQELNQGMEGFYSGQTRTKPWGTGHAVLAAAGVINSPFAVINADDFYGADSYRIACDYCHKTKVTQTNYALIGYELEKTLSEFGSVSRGICSVESNNMLNSLVERTEIKRNENGIKFKEINGNWSALNGSEVVSMNMFVFTPAVFSSLKNLFVKFLTDTDKNTNSEFFLPSALDTLIKIKKAEVKVLKTKEQWFGLTYKEDKNMVEEEIRKLVKTGKYPSKLWG